MLSAYNITDGSKIDTRTVTEQEWDTTVTSLARQKLLVSPYSDSLVYTTHRHFTHDDHGNRTPKTRRRVFALYPGGTSGRTEPETDFHMQLKQEALRAALDAGYESDVEVPLPDRVSRQAVADVLVTRPESRDLAIEIQRSKQSDTEYAKRTERYRKLGVDSIWFEATRHPELAVHHMIEDGSTVALDGSDARFDGPIVIAAVSGSLRVPIDGESGHVILPVDGSIFEITVYQFVRMLLEHRIQVERADLYGEENRVAVEVDEWCCRTCDARMHVWDGRDLHGTASGISAAVERSHASHNARNNPVICREDMTVMCAYCKSACSQRLTADRFLAPIGCQRDAPYIRVSSMLGGVEPTAIIGNNTHHATQPWVLDGETGTLRQPEWELVDTDTQVDVLLSTCMSCHKPALLWHMRANRYWDDSDNGGRAEQQYGQLIQQHVIPLSINGAPACTFTPACDWAWEYQTFTCPHCDTVFPESRVKDMATLLTITVRDGKFHDMRADLRCWYWDVYDCDEIREIECEHCHTSMLKHSVVQTDTQVIDSRKQKTTLNGILAGLQEQCATSMPVAAADQCPKCANRVNSEQARIVSLIPYQTVYEDTHAPAGEDDTSGLKLDILLIETSCECGTRLVIPLFAEDGSQIVASALRRLIQQHYPVSFTGSPVVLAAVHGRMQWDTHEAFCPKCGRTFPTMRFESQDAALTMRIDAAARACLGVSVNKEHPVWWQNNRAVIVRANECGVCGQEYLTATSTNEDADSESMYLFTGEQTTLETVANRIADADGTMSVARDGACPKCGQTANIHQHGSRAYAIIPCMSTPPEDQPIPLLADGIVLSESVRRTSTPTISMPREEGERLLLCALHYAAINRHRVPQWLAWCITRNVGVLSEHARGRVDSVLRAYTPKLRWWFMEASSFRGSDSDGEQHSVLRFVSSRECRMLLWYAYLYDQLTLRDAERIAFWGTMPILLSDAKNLVNSD